MNFPILLFIRPSTGLRTLWDLMAGRLGRLCSLYTSEAADEEDSVDLVGRGGLKKKEES